MASTKPVWLRANTPTRSSGPMPASPSAAASAATRPVSSANVSAPVSSMTAGASGNRAALYS